MHEESSKQYILKPSLEGGGHNVYGSAIPAFLSRTPEEEWANYIFMKEIASPVVQNCLMSPQGLYKGGVVSELGVFGVCLWRRMEGVKVEVIKEEEPSWSFKTKKRGVDEMSVVKGFGCFGSPALVEGAVFEACCLQQEEGEED